MNIDHIQTFLEDQINRAIDPHKKRAQELEGEVARLTADVEAERARSARVSKIIIDCLGDIESIKKEYSPKRKTASLTKMPTDMRVVAKTVDALVDAGFGKTDLPNVSEDDYRGYIQGKHGRRYHYDHSAPMMQELFSSKLIDDEDSFLLQALIPNKFRSVSEIYPLADALGYTMSRSSVYNRMRSLAQRFPHAIEQFEDSAWMAKSGESPAFDPTTIDHPIAKLMLSRNAPHADGWWTLDNIVAAAKKAKVPLPKLDHLSSFDFLEQSMPAQGNKPKWRLRRA